MQVLLTHILDQDVIEALERNGLVGHNLGDTVGSNVGIGEAEHQQHASGGAGDEAHSGFQHRDAGALGAHQRTRNVKAVFRQQLVEVVAGNAARYVGEARADKVGVGVSQRFEACIDVAAPPAFANDLCELLVCGLAHAQAQAIVGEDIQHLDVLARLARHHGVGAAGIVADHAAQRTLRVGRRIGAESEMRALGGGAQHIQDDAGLDACDLPPRIDREDGAHVLGHVDDDGGVAALPCQASPAAARQQGDSIAPAERDGLDDVLYAAGKHDADGHLAVVGAIGRVERPAPLVKAHLTVDAGA
ncbi:MAG TPA: hypothetical protein VKB35_00645 [Ktedonobacteraceae bacterium]|nr:hypothetical protein [Ktedonobacteraceae bacterium]